MAFDIASKVNSLKSPSYVFSEELFRERAEKVKEAFFGTAEICFSIKANPFLLSMLPEDFSLVEVCSPGELEICKALNILPERILFSGVNKNKEEIAKAVEYGAAYITAESPMHFLMINEVGIEKGVRISTLIRLTSDSQFGMDGDEILKFIEARNEYHGVEISGLHYFSGTQKRSIKDNIKELDKLDIFIKKIEADLNFKIERLEYGTGLPSTYFSTPEEAEKEEGVRLVEMADALKEFRNKNQQLHITVEMGRFFASQAGFYLSSVCDIKVNDGINYAIMDGGAHQLKYDGQLGGMLIPHLRVFRIAAESNGDVREIKGEKEWTLAGSLCTTQDIIVRNAALGELEIGDVLVFHRAGAYSVTEGIALFLSRDLPSIYGIHEDGEIELFRERIETYRFNMPG